MKFTMMVRTMLGAAALSAAVAAGAQVAAPPAGPGFGGGFGGHRPPMERAFGPMGAEGRFWNDPTIVSKLSLTDEQRKSFDQILLQHRSTLIDLHASLEKAELAMQPLMSSDQPDENRVLAQIDAIAQSRAQLEKANARYLLAIRAKLTPEQWKTLQAARSERAQQFHDRARSGAQRHQGPPQGGPAPDGLGGNGPGYF
jgi:Spy/CpxP family protein refolding chaperone